MCVCECVCVCVCACVHAHTHAGTHISVCDGSRNSPEAKEISHLLKHYYTSVASVYVIRVYMCVNVCKSAHIEDCNIYQNRMALL